MRPIDSTCLTSMDNEIAQIFVRNPADRHNTFVLDSVMFSANLGKLHASNMLDKFRNLKQLFRARKFVPHCLAIEMSN